MVINLLRMFTFPVENNRYTKQFTHKIYDFFPRVGILCQSWHSVIIWCDDWLRLEQSVWSLVAAVILVFIRDAVDGQ